MSLFENFLPQTSSWPEFDLFYEGVPLQVTPIPVQFFSILFLGLLLLFGIMYAAHPNFCLEKSREALKLTPSDALAAHLYGYPKLMRGFLFLQTILLSGICLYFVLNYFSPQFSAPYPYLFYCIGGVWLWYLFKKFIYWWIGRVFVSKDLRRLWGFHHFIYFSLFGVVLYLPYALFLLPTASYRITFFILLGIYIIYRLFYIVHTLSIFKFNIFYTLHLILYLCGTEILPLVALVCYMAGGIA